MLFLSGGRMVRGFLAVACLEARAQRSGQSSSHKVLSYLVLHRGQILPEQSFKVTNPLCLQPTELLPYLFYKQVNWRNCCPATLL